MNIWLYLLFFRISRSKMPSIVLNSLGFKSDIQRPNEYIQRYLLPAVWIDELRVIVIQSYIFIGKEILYGREKELVEFADSTAAISVRIDLRRLLRVEAVD